MDDQARDESCVTWIDLAQSRKKHWAAVKTARNHQFPENAGNVLTT